MIKFEEELKHFQPSTDVDDAADAIHQKNLTDMTDIIMELLKNQSAPASGKK